MRSISSFRRSSRWSRRLDVDELRHRRGGEVVLVLEARDLLVGRDPAVALAVDADEHVALLEVGAVELAGRMRAGAELEHDRRQAQPLDRGARRAALVGEFAQGRAHEHPDPLVGRADRRALDDPQSCAHHGPPCPARASMSPARNSGRGSARLYRSLATFQEPDWTRRVIRRIVGSCALGFPLPSYGGRLCLRAPASRTRVRSGVWRPGFRGQMSTPP